MSNERPDRTWPSRRRIVETELKMTRLRVALHREIGITKEEWLTACLRHVADFQNIYRLGVEPASEEPE